jgi:hypothetical protein
VIDLLLRALNAAREIRDQVIGVVGINSTDVLDPGSGLRWRLAFILAGGITHNRASRSNSLHVASIASDNRTVVKAMNSNASSATPPR